MLIIIINEGHLNLVKVRELALQLPIETRN